MGFFFFPVQQYSDNDHNPCTGLLDDSGRQGTTREHGHDLTGALSSSQDTAGHHGTDGQHQTLTPATSREDPIDLRVPQLEEIE